VRAGARDVLDVRVTPQNPAGYRVSLTLRSGTVDTGTCGDLEELLDHLLSRRVPLHLIDRAFATLEPGYRPEPRSRHRPRRFRWIALRDLTRWAARTGTVVRGDHLAVRRAPGP
jgi:hypothetical protein